MPEPGRPDRNPLEAAPSNAVEPAPAAPPKRDWNRYKALQKELADKGRQSLQERGVLKTEKDAPELDRDQPEIKIDRGFQR